jgi:hypothetical protein
MKQGFTLEARVSRLEGEVAELKALTLSPDEVADLKALAVSLRDRLDELERQSEAA